MPAWVDNAGYLHLEGSITDDQFKYAMQQLVAKRRWVDIMDRNLKKAEERLQAERDRRFKDRTRFLATWRRRPTTLRQDVARQMAWKQKRSLKGIVQKPWNATQRGGYKRLVRDRKK